MQTKINDLQWLIGGEAGFGIKVTGQMFSRMCVRGGLFTFDYTEYPSLIRGGHNSYQVDVRDHPVFSSVRPINLLVALNQETIISHADRLSPGAGVLFDPDGKETNVSVFEGKEVQLYAVPLTKLAREACGTILMRNVVALGASVGLLRYDLDLLLGVLHTAFDRKGEKTVTANINAAKAGYDFAQNHLPEFPWKLERKRDTKKHMGVQGNAAIALGAIQAGCKFFAGYPMTPATSILTLLARHAVKTGMVVRHAEDEISVINEAIGASYAGARSMVATSGGGFALMAEGVGLAGMAEVPLVIVVAQRPGPATGLPTWTSQADFQFVLHAGQDESPRIVLAPGDARECFYATVQAFNFADKYQMPVFILTDKFLGESQATIDPFTTDHLARDRGALNYVPQPSENGLYDRYRITADGVSPRTLPGMPGGLYTANSDEHDAIGAVDESAENRIAQMEKRMKKLETARTDVPVPSLYGPAAADLTLVCWGSTKGPAIDAMELLARQGKTVNVLHFVYLHPLPVVKVTGVLRHCHNTLLVENNYSGQFGKHLMADIGFQPEHTMLRYDGRPFFTDEIAHKALSVLA